MPSRPARRRVALGAALAAGATLFAMSVDGIAGMDDDVRVAVQREQTRTMLVSERTRGDCPGERPAQAWRDY